MSKRARFELVSVVRVGLFDTIMQVLIGDFSDACVNCY